MDPTTPGLHQSISNEGESLEELRTENVRHLPLYQLLHCVHLNIHDIHFDIL